MPVIRLRVLNDFFTVCGHFCYAVLVFVFLFNLLFLTKVELVFIGGTYSYTET